jgi:predicted CXXCH cytochrome family protein
LSGPESEQSSTSAEKAETQGADAADNVKKLIKMVQHPPFAERMCDNCHRLPEKTGGAPMGFALLREREELCQMCHDEMSRESLAETYTWVHGPVQYGACVKCHQPHESPNPYMLRANPVRKLCFRCHDESRVLQGDIHGEIGEMDCTECHDPHGGPERYYLKM